MKKEVTDQIVIEMQRAVYEFGKRTGLSIAWFSITMDAKNDNAIRVMLDAGRQGKPHEKVQIDEMYSFLAIAHLWNEFKKEEELEQ